MWGDGFYLGIIPTKKKKIGRVSKNYVPSPTEKEAIRAEERGCKTGFQKGASSSSFGKGRMTEDQKGVGDAIPKRGEG